MDRSKTTLRQALRNAHLPRWLGLVVLVAIAGLAGAGTARAHVTIAPPFVDVGTTATIAFETPNERPPHRTTALAVHAPPGVELSAAQPPAGWRLDLSGGTARWSGGTIAGRAVVRFPLSVTARIPAGTAMFRATQTYDDGESVRWDAALTVLPASGSEAPPQHFDRALAAGAVGLVVIAGSFLALRLLRRRPLQER
jgi:hypothetical protein